MFNNNSFIFCICFLYILIIKSTFALKQQQIEKRQAIASRTCGDQNNTVAICSPTSTSIWSNNTDQEITWKWNNPTFDQYTKLDLYLLYQNASSVNTTNYQTIKTWPGLDKSKGILVQHIDNSWYPSPIQNNQPNVTYIMYLYIIGAGYDIQQDLDLIPTARNFFPLPQSFSLIQSSINTTTTTTPTSSSSPTTSATNPTTSTTSNTNSDSKNLSGWAIAVIVIAALLFLLACAALIWAYKRYQNRKQSPPNHNEDEKIPVLTPNKNDSNIAVGGGAGTNIVTTPTTPTSGHNTSQVALGTAAAAMAGAGAGVAVSSINSSTQQLWSPRSLSPTNNNRSIEQQQQQNQLGLNSEANQSSSILSSTDALMIADTFRQFMRKPDWNEELELNEQNKRNNAIIKE